MPTPLLWIEQTGRRRFVVTAMGTPYWSAGPSAGGALLDFLARYGFRIGIAVVVDRTHEKGFCVVPIPGVSVCRNPAHAWEYTMDRVERAFSAMADALERHRRATDPQADTTCLTALAADAVTPIRQAVARHHNTPPTVLEQLAQDPDLGVRRNVAANPNTPSATLHRFVVEKPVFVILLQGVAANRNTTPETLELLAADTDEDVRIDVARNPRTDEASLRRLATDSVMFVRLHVALNPNAPRDILVSLNHLDGQAVVRQAAASTLIKKDLADAT